MSSSHAMKRANPSSVSGLRLVDKPVDKVTLDSDSAVDRMFMLDEIGKGTFAVVFRGTERKTGKDWAVKRIKRPESGSADNKKYYELISREIRILTKVDHPHIINLDRVLTSPTYINLVLEYCSEGTLEEFLDKQGNLVEDDAKDVVGQLGSALTYLHSNDIIHRDLKPANILLTTVPDSTKDEGRKLLIKITDFGLSVIKKLSDMLTDFVGTPNYIAPEIMAGKTYDELCDIWSVGVIAYQTISLDLPFTEGDETDLRNNIMNQKLSFESSEIWPDVSEECKDLIGWMLQKKVVDRASARSITSHKWITGVEPEYDPRGPDPFCPSTGKPSKTSVRKPSFTDEVDE